MDRPEAYKDFDLTDRPGEAWNDVVGFEGLYMVSDHGRIKSLGRTVKTRNQTTEFEVDIAAKIMKGNPIGKGYLQVDLRKNGERFPRLIHVLVGTCFVENPDCKPQLNHDDGNKLNNAAYNLGWCTNKENQEHAHRSGLQSKRYSKHSNSKSLTSELIKEIRALRGETQKLIALRYGISEGSVHKIINRTTYKNVN